MSDRIFSLSKRTTVIVFLAASLLFAALTVFFQEQLLGLKYIETGTQLERHQAVLNGTAPNAWQFRVLSEYLVEGWLTLLRTVGIPHPVGAAFLSFRVFQNSIIFVLAAFYYRKLGVNVYLVLIGLSALAWGMTHALVDSDLQFSNYSDVIFYLAAALVILHNRDTWIIPIMVLAALNRETSGAIPLILFAARVQLKPFQLSKRVIATVVAAFLIFVIAFVGLRYFYGLDRPVSGTVGLKLFIRDTLNFRAWAQMLATLSIWPIMAIAAYRTWPKSLKAFFWAVVPIWFIVIPFTGGFMETRHYLVPQSLVFIPGALLGAAALANRSGRKVSAET